MVEPELDSAWLNLSRAKNKAYYMFLPAIGPLRNPTLDRATRNEVVPRVCPRGADGPAVATEVCNEALAVVSGFRGRIVIAIDRVLVRVRDMLLPVLLLSLGG